MLVAPTSANARASASLLRSSAESGTVKGRLREALVQTVVSLVSRAARRSAACPRSALSGNLSTNFRSAGQLRSGRASQANRSVRVGLLPRPSAPQASASDGCKKSIEQRLFWTEIVLRTIQAIQDMAPTALMRRQCRPAQAANRWPRTSAPERRLRYWSMKSLRRRTASPDARPTAPRRASDPLQHAPRSAMA